MGSTPSPRLEPVTGLATSALLFLAFAGLLAAVLGSAWAGGWDDTSSAWVHAHVMEAGLRLSGRVSLLGSPVAWGIAGVAITALLVRRELALAAVFGGGKVVETALKAAVHRPRPPYAASALKHYSFSFPSGHAMGSILCYGMLAYTLTALWEPARRHRRLVWLGAALVVGLVSASRIYLGVHFPTDVAGGLLAGGAWLLLWMTIAEASRASVRPVERTPADDRTGV
jgi:membrane-associated phospholipid phosphatase